MDVIDHIQDINIGDTITYWEMSLTPAPSISGNWIKVQVQYILKNGAYVTLPKSHFIFSFSHLSKHTVNHAKKD